jgi:hypothetical protein
MRRLVLNLLGRAVRCEIMQQMRLEKTEENIENKDDLIGENLE